MKAIISLSGGMDSATVLAEAISHGREPITVGFTYGSKHNVYENRKARQLANYYHIPFQIINLETTMESFKSNLFIGQGNIPEGHYEDESMKQTIVPGRNLIFISILAGLAESIEAEEVWLGIHAGDHAIYPDCRPDFFQAANLAVTRSTENKVVLRAPFLHKSKAEILKRGICLGVPYELTRTCYKNQKLACGKCGSCIERLEAFQMMNIKDPIYYDERINS